MVSHRNFDLPQGAIIIPVPLPDGTVVKFVKLQNGSTIPLCQLTQQGKMPKSFEATTTKGGEGHAIPPKDVETAPLILHPALEVRRDLALIGFRHQLVSGDEIKTENVFFIATPAKIAVTANNIVDLPGGKGVLDIRGKILPLASQRVNLEQLQIWAKAPTAPGPSQVYSEIKTTVKRYIYLPEPAYGLIAAWIMGTYFYYTFAAYPFLLILGPKTTGKSNTLFVLAQLSFNAYLETHLTAPALADTTDTLRGTLALDHAMNLEANPDLLSILIASYKREGGRRRLVTLTKTGRRVDEFESYSPKAFASLRPLPEDLADRCYSVNTSPAPFNLPNPSASREDWMGMRTKLTKLLLSHYSQVCQLAQEGTHEESRFGELWLPIEVMLNLAKVEAKEIEVIRDYCSEKFSLTKFELDAWDEALVRATLDAPDKVSSSELLQALHTNLSLSEDEPKPGHKWQGRALQRLGLIKQKGRHREAGKQELYYVLDKEQASRLLTYAPGDIDLQTNGTNGTTAQ